MLTIMAKTAVAFGTFDILHPGHIHYLRSASRYGKLEVVVARDSSVEMLKGHAPLMDEKSRVEIVGSLKFVHKAVLGDSIRKWNDIYGILPRLKPDYLVFGYDQKVDMKYLKGIIEKNGLKVKIIRLRPVRKERFKSSKLRELLSSKAR